MTVRRTRYYSVTVNVEYCTSQTQDKRPRRITKRVKSKKSYGEVFPLLPRIAMQIVPSDARLTGLPSIREVYVARIEEI